MTKDFYISNITYIISDFDQKTRRKTGINLKTSIKNQQIFAKYNV